MTGETPESAERVRLRAWLEQTVRAQVDDAHRSAAKRRAAIDHEHAKRGTANSGIRLLDLFRANDEAAHAAADSTLEQVAQMFRHVTDPAEFHKLAQEVVVPALTFMVRSAGLGVIEQARRRGGGSNYALHNSIGQSTLGLQSRISGRLVQLRTAEEQRRAGPEARAADEMAETMNRVDETTQRTLVSVEDTRRHVKWLTGLASDWYVKQVRTHPWLLSIGNLLAGAILGALASHWLEKLLAR